MPKTEKDSATDQPDIGMAAAVRAALKGSVPQSGKSVEQVADGISKRLRHRITAGMISDRIAESHLHRFPLEWAAAWIAETKDFSLLYVLTDELGLPRQTQEDADLLAYGKHALQKDLTESEMEVLKARILKGGARG